MTCGLLCGQTSVVEGVGGGGGGGGKSEEKVKAVVISFADLRIR